MDQPATDQAAKILDRERAHIAARVAERSASLPSPASALDAVTEIINLRGRYFGITGEHFSVQELEGIRIIDELDERLIRAIREVLKAYVDAHRRNLPDLKVLAMLSEKLLAGSRAMPQYPIAYMVLYGIRTQYEKFQELIAAGTHDLADLEHALVHHLLGVTDRYVQTRERPVMRHFSDVAREYGVVSRLKCSCGDEKFDVKMQSICKRPDGNPYDKLDLQCRACGAQRTIAFDLPHFKDMYQV